MKTLITTTMALGFIMALGASQAEAWRGHRGYVYYGPAYDYGYAYGPAYAYPGYGYYGYGNRGLVGNVFGSIFGY